MLSDDEILDGVRRRASAIRRRHRVLTGGAAVLVVTVVLATVALAGAGGEDRDTVSTDTDRTTAPTPTTTEARDPASTTSRPAPPSTAPTTSAPPGDASTTTVPPDRMTAPADPTSTVPPAPTATTAVPPVTAGSPSPPATVSQSVTKDGLTLEVSVTYPTEPGERHATATVRLRTARGSRPGGGIVFDSSDRGSTRSFGSRPGDLSCLTTPSSDPDPAAGPVDKTWTLSYDYWTGPGRRRVGVNGFSSFCTADQATVEVELWVTIP